MHCRSLFSFILQIFPNKTTFLSTNEDINSELHIFYLEMELSEAWVFCEQYDSDFRLLCVETEAKQEKLKDQNIQPQ